MDENDNIIRLAEFQDNGELSPAAEESLALAYAERHAHELRYVAAWGRWMNYDGIRWDVDETLHAFDRARAICREWPPIAIRRKLQPQSHRQKLSQRSND